MIRPELTVTGIAEVDAMLKRTGANVNDLQGAMSEVGYMARRYFSGQVFASRGAVLGERWPPLSARYAVEKARRWPGRIPMIRTGLLNRSFRHEAHRMNVTIYNDAPYFKYHQSSAPRTKIPRRVMIGIYSSLNRDVTKLVVDSLVRRAQSRAS